METLVLPVILIWQTLVFTRLLRQLFEQLCCCLYLRWFSGAGSVEFFHIVWRNVAGLLDSFPGLLSGSLMPWLERRRRRRRRDTSTYDGNKHNTFLLKNDVTITYKPVIPCALIYHHDRHTAKAGVAFLRNLVCTQRALSQRGLFAG